MKDEGDGVGNVGTWTPLTHISNPGNKSQGPDVDGLLVLVGDE